MANSPRKMHNPDFSYSQIKFPDRDIFGPDSFGLSEINWVHPFVGPFIQFDKKKFIAAKKSFCRQTNNFVKSICFLLLQQEIFLFSQNKCFVQSYIFVKTGQKYFSFCYTDCLPITVATLFAPFLNPGFPYLPTTPSLKPFLWSLYFSATYSLKPAVEYGEVQSSFWPVINM